jgi:hypothetical protein
MAYVNPNSTVNDFIERCFNSQLPPGQATSGDCGFTYSKNTKGSYHLDFGFQVSDRFILAQAQVQQAGWYATVSPADQAGTGVTVYMDDGVSTANAPFFIVVF